MAVDTEYISRKDFNSKFKNYLRDFYVYQFKNKHIDFFNTGSFSRSRMVAVIIACTVDKSIQAEDLFRVKMSNIDVSKDLVTLVIIDECTKKVKQEVKIRKPLCEMFKYLYTADVAAFFITGNTAKLSTASKERFEREIESFKKNCPSPRTEEKMYRYWGQIYLDEANEIITPSTYRNDSERLRELVSKMSKNAKVQWSEGCKIDYDNEVLSEETDSCISCVTSDTRELMENPFHMLYRYCNRYTNSDNDFVNIFFALIMYFNIGKSLRCRNDLSLTEERMKNFNVYLKDIAASLASKTKEKKKAKTTDEKETEEKSWEQLTSKQKDRYASKAPDRFLNECFTSIVESVIDEYEFQFEFGDEKEKEKAKKVIEKLKKRFKEYRTKYPERYKLRIKRDGEITWRDIAIWDDVKDDVKTIAKIKDSRMRTISTYDDEYNDYIDVFFYIVCNRQNIKYNGSDFVFENIDWIEKKSLYLAVLDFIGCGEKQFSNTLGELVNAGLFCEKVESDNIYYSISSNNMKTVLGNDIDLISRFSEMVSFFSQTALLGEVGSYISDRLPPKTWKMYFKHNYIVRALNDYNNIELLYAMQNPTLQKHYWVEIECRDALNECGYQHFVCYPIEIRENVADGKQYLIYYHPVYRSVASIRIDFIDKVTIYKKWEKTEQFVHFGADIERAYKLIKCTWGLQFKDFYEGNVKADPHPSKVTFTIRFMNEHIINGKKVSENFIKDRIKREINEELGYFEEEWLNTSYSLLKITVNVINPFDMLHWIRTYTTRIYDVKIEYSGYMDDVERADKMYILPSPERISLSLPGRNNVELYASDAKPVLIESQGENLFNEIYSETFKKLSSVLFGIILHKTVDGGLIEKLRCAYIGPRPSKLALQTELDKFENDKKQFEKFFSKFAFEVADGYAPVFSITEGTSVSTLYDFIPLTKIETQWLINVLNHKLARAFLSTSEIENIQAKLPKMKWFDVFDSETVKLSERHSEASLEEYYDKVLPRTADISNETCFEIADYGIIIRKMMQAIQERKVVEVTYCSQYGRTTDYTFVPYCIEYSKRDNRFRVKAVCQIEDEKTKKLIFWGVRTFPVDLISAYKETGEVVPEGIINKNVNIYKGLNADGTKIPVKKRNKRNRGGTREIVVRFSDCDGVPDKILTEFSCYEKTCVRWGNGRYSMNLSYYEEDHKEIVIRLLGYGSLITVTSTDNSDPVVKELKERYNNQVALYRERVSTKAKQGKDGIDTAFIANDESVVADTSEKERED